MLYKVPNHQLELGRHRRRSRKEQKEVLRAIQVSSAAQFHFEARPTATMLGRSLVVVSLLSFTLCISTGDLRLDLRSLIETLRVAPSEYEADAALQAFVLGLNVTEAKRRRENDSRGQLYAYIFNFANILHRVTETELQEIADSTGYPKAYLGYLKNSTSEARSNGGQPDIEYLLRDLRINKDNLRLALWLKVALDYIEDKNLRPDENMTVNEVINLTDAEIVAFQEVVWTITYEAFGRATQSQLIEAAEITDDPQIRHLVSLTMHDIHQDASGLLSVLRNTTYSSEVHAALVWFTFGTNFSSALQLRRRDRVKFEREYALKLSDLLAKASEGDLNEIVELRGYNMPEDILLLQRLFVSNCDVRTKLGELITTMSNATSKDEAADIFYAYVMDSTVTEAKRLKNDDPKGWVVDYVVNYASFLIKAPEGELKKLAELSTDQPWILGEHLRNFVLNQTANENQLDLDFFLSNLTISTNVTNAGKLLNFALMIKTAMDYVNGDGIWSQYCARRKACFKLTETNHLSTYERGLFLTKFNSLITRLLIRQTTFN